MTYQDPDAAYDAWAEQQTIAAHEEPPRLRAVGLVLSAEPFSAITADLAHGRLLLTTAGRTIAVSGQQLRDLLRLGRLAATPTTCWRCDRPMLAQGPDCDVCHHQAHCDRCDGALHTGGR